MDPYDRGRLPRTVLFDVGPRRRKPRLPPFPEFDKTAERFCVDARTDGSVRREIVALRLEPRVVPR